MVRGQGPRPRRKSHDFESRVEADIESGSRIGTVAITRDEVLHVARLARLALTDEEVERLGSQLSAILEAVGKVAELDLADVEPTSHPLDLANVSADDESRPSLSADEVFANAPDREDDFFRVPPA
ncbi:MAG: Asp-tRNA(Asn)/Glu-tRNA(Gln) amidotransferase subunit GatC [Actinobacteria bacterium]|nr:Asp-tRNA(Asn)/Glu-tRNA(Gln) amidotransferase subunit GatC [Actinomycetota bacterium]